MCVPDDVEFVYAGPCEGFGCPGLKFRIQGLGFLHAEGFTRLGFTCSGGWSEA